MKNVLVCDDDYLTLKLVENKLKLDGYGVKIVQDGKRAIDELESSDFDLIISDMHMPFITGMELIDFVRNDLKKNTPIIIITKDISESTSEDAYSLGADDYLNKPINLNILSVKVKKFLT